MKKSYRRALEKLAEKTPTIELEIIDAAKTIWNEIGPDIESSFDDDEPIHRSDVIDFCYERMFDRRGDMMSEEAFEHLDNLNHNEIREILVKAFPHEYV